MKLSCRLLLSLSLPLLLASCGLLQVRGDAKRHYAFTVITGQVTTPADWQGGVSIAAITADEEAPRVVHRIWLHEPGGYELIVPPGRYTVEAVADADNRGSPASSLKAASSLIAVHDSGVITQVDLVLQRSPRVLAHDPIAISARHSTQAGALAGLGSPLLSSASGRQGYWTPVETFQQIGGNVYFLSPYDPGRIPVLFVHGAQGSGADWRHLALTLGDEYQPWIFQYPSGASLEAMSHLLYWKLLNLRMRYGFSRLHIGAQHGWSCGPPLPDRPRHAVPGDLGFCLAFDTVGRRCTGECRCRALSSDRALMARHAAAGRVFAGPFCAAAASACAACVGIRLPGRLVG